MNQLNLKSLTTILTSLALVAMPATAMALEANDEGGTGSSAEATGAEIEGVIVISDSEAREGEASSTGLEIMGEEVSGTSQEEPGSSESSLVDSGDAGVPEDAASVKVANATATVEEDGSSRSSSDLLIVDVGNGLLRIELFSSDASSDGHARSDAVSISSTEDPTGEGIQVLHAEANGDQGESGIIYLGGNGILTSEQTGGLCATQLVIVGADLICVAATEGEGATAEVAGDVTIGGEPIGTVVGTETTLAPSEPAPAADPEVLGETIEPADALPSLPRTGLNALGLILTSAGALTAGERLRRRGRKA